MSENPSDGGPQPNGEREAQWTGPVLVRSVALSGLLVLAACYTLYFAAPVLMPIAVAFLTSLVLSAPVRALDRLGIPTAVSAAVVMMGLAGAVGSSIYFLIEPATEWIEQAPQALADLDEKLRPLKQSVEDVTEQAHEAARAANIDTDLNAAAESPIQLRRDTIASLLLSDTPRAAGGLLVLCVLLYFWLASGDNFLRKLVAILPRLDDKKRAVETVRTVQSDVSRYLATIAAINLCLGVATAVVMWALGVPSPALWGMMAAVFNFAPYVGALASLGVLTVVGLSTFDSVTHGLVVPGAFLVLTAIEGQFVTPMILGRSLALSPLAVFLSVLLLGWMWGLTGALIAVPMLAVLNIVCQRVPALRPVAEFLGP